MQQPALRPLGFGEILDGAFVLYRRNFAAFLVLAGLPFLPVLAWRLGMASADPLGASSMALEWVMNVVVTGLLGVMASGALIRATADAYGGRPVDWRASFARTRAGYWRLLYATVSMRVRIGLGFIMLIVPGVYLAVHYFAVEQATVLEDVPSAVARERSEALANGAEWRILGMMAVLTAMTYLPAFAQGTVVGVLVGAGYAVNPHLPAAATMILAILVLPLTMAAYTLLYYDRRVRVEAMDVHVAMGHLSVAG
jgi:hypothetical protein